MTRNLWVLLLWGLISAAGVMRAAEGDGPAWGDKIKRAPLEIPVVRTWAQLSATKVIEIGEGVKVRLGLEAAQAPRLSGVLIYALAEGFDSNELDDPDAQLGPLKMEVETPEQKLAVLRDGPSIARKAADWDGAALFCRVVALKSAGEYRVKLSSYSGTLLATATIKAVEEPYHAWTAFHSVRWNEIEEAPLDTILTGYLSYSRFDPAVPYLSGADPLLVVDEATLKREAPLPRLQDGAATPEIPGTIARTQALIRALAEDDFDLRENATRELRGLLPEALPHLEKARSRAVDVETRSRLEGLIRSALATTLHVQASPVEAILTFPGGLHASWAEDYYLARWWVNEKEVILKPNEVFQDLHKVGAMRMAEQLRLRWKVDWAALGAKSGDRVGLQIQYCPAGHQLVLHDPAKSMKLKTILEFGQKPVLSNKTEFVLP